MAQLHSLFRAAFFVAFRTPAFCQVGLDAPPGGGDWFSVDDPRGVGEAVLDALELAEDGVKVGLCARVQRNDSSIQSHTNMVL